MSVFNVFRRGYELGYAHGSNGRRHIAEWEVVFFAPITLIPLVDRTSFIQGYHCGFSDGAAGEKFISRAGGRLALPKH
ncbi:MAG: hypothetical protein HYU59_04950 [Magnetospirillum gryphiswaldense]|nr:hypothetical protein [Magnetospirillum gryphiswaldense]